MAEPEDPQTIAMLVQGDAESFKALVRSYEDYIYDLCLKMTGRRQDAEDLAQETFIAAYSNLKGFDPRYKLSNWLYTIALNLCRNFLYRQKLLRFFSLDAPDPEGGLDSPPLSEKLREKRPGVEEELKRREASRFLSKIILGLPIALRPAFILKYLRGLSLQEIAQILRISVPNVKIRLFRARTRLYKQYKKDLPNL